MATEGKTCNPAQFYAWLHDIGAKSDGSNTWTRNSKSITIRAATRYSQVDAEEVCRAFGIDCDSVEILFSEENQPDAEEAITPNTALAV